MEIEKDKWVEIDRKGYISTTVYIPSNYPGPIALNASINQPERLNPEGINIKKFDGILNPDWIVNLVNTCDSPTCENK